MNLIDDDQPCRMLDRLLR